MIQSVDCASASGALDERQLALEVALPLLAAQREELARLRLDRIGGLAVAMPQRLRLRARRFGRLLPALLDVVQVAGHLVEIVGLHPLGRIEAVLRAKRLGPGDQLFLDGGVREPLPLVQLAQLVELRRDTGTGPPDSLGKRRACSRSGDGGGRVDRRAHLARDAVRFAEREILGRCAGRGALDQLLEAQGLLLQHPLCGRPTLFGAQSDARLSSRESFADGRVERLRLRIERCPLLLHRRPRTVLMMFRRCEPFGFRRQRVETAVCVFTVLQVPMPLLGAATGLFEALACALVFEFLRGGPRQSFPLRPRLLDLVERVLGPRVLQPLADRLAGAPKRRVPIGCGATFCVLMLARGYRGVRRLHQGPEPCGRVLIQLEGGV